MAVTVTVRGANLSGLNAYRNRIRGSVDDVEIRIGVFGPRADLMSYIEYGTENIPAAAPLRKTVSQKQGEWTRELGAAMRGRVFETNRWGAALGQAASADVQLAFEEGLTPRLKEATVKRKQRLGYSAHAAKRGILTGETQQAITYNVVRHGS